MNRATLRVVPAVIIMFFCLTILLPMGAAAHNVDAPYKLVPGMPFTYFDLSDIFNQHWVSNYLRGRPIVILTGHRDQRFEILKWADLLKREFGDTGAAHILWVVNLRHVPWNTSRETVFNQWRSFGAPVPVLMDWHGVVGRHMQINYNAPNIICIDADGRLVFHQIHTYMPDVYTAVATQIRTVAMMSPGMSKPATLNPAEVAAGNTLAPTPRANAKGTRGNSY
ncbi:MAG: hypothetical protein HQM09_16705 [Candidatus Riflebacteria bacterium]|nr:hypothetical protein [Candidatus Riflebacteria bacterium]